MFYQLFIMKVWSQPGLASLVVLCTLPAGEGGERGGGKKKMKFWQFFHLVIVATFDSHMDPLHGFFWQ